jgi:hypothetical protein
MEIKLNPEESEEIFYNSLCNAVGTGWMSGYGLELTCDRSQYKSSREHLERLNPDSSPCYEDILMQVLRDGGELTMVDHESDDEKTSITLKDVHERTSLTPATNLINITSENDDAIDADCVVQTVFFGEIVYG